MGSGIIVVCPLCLSIFMNDYDEDDLCPNCEIENLMEYEEYKMRLSSSFMDSISREEELNEQ